VNDGARIRIGPEYSNGPIERTSVRMYVQDQLYRGWADGQVERIGERAEELLKFCSNLADLLVQKELLSLNDIERLMGIGPDVLNPDPTFHADRIAAALKGN
jgi:hypothetical protein